MADIFPDGTPVPPDWGIMKAVCADGQHRFLPDAPKCGCGAVINQAVEYARLEKAVVEAAKAWGTTNYRLTDLCELREESLSAAVDALIEFEAKGDGI